MTGPKAPPKQEIAQAEPVQSEEDLEALAKRRRELEAMRTGLSDLRVENTTGLAVSRSQTSTTGLSLL